MKRRVFGIGLFALMLGGAAADAQSATNMAALKGLAPVSALSKTADGMAALASNFTVTGGIQTGAIRQPTLLPFAEQQQQALRDAFITDGNLAQLTDGLGTTLGAAYRGARALSRPGALHQHLQGRLGCDRLRQLDIADRIRTPANISSPTARRTAKSRFPTRPWPSSRTIDGAPDPFGMAYGRPAGTPGADMYGEFPPVPDRADDPADRGAGLFQCSRQQRGL